MPSLDTIRSLDDLVDTPPPEAISPPAYPTRAPARPTDVLVCALHDLLKHAPTGTDTYLRGPRHDKPHGQDAGMSLWGTRQGRYILGVWEAVNQPPAVRFPDLPATFPTHGGVAALTPLAPPVDWPAGLNWSDDAPMGRWLRQLLAAWPAPHPTMGASCFPWLTLDPVTQTVTFGVRIGAHPAWQASVVTLPAALPAGTTACTIRVPRVFGAILAVLVQHQALRAYGPPVIEQLGRSLLPDGLWVDPASGVVVARVSGLDITVQGRVVAQPPVLPEADRADWWPILDSDLILNTRSTATVAQVLAQHARTRTPTGPAVVELRAYPRVRSLTHLLDMVDPATGTSLLDNGWEPSLATPGFCGVDPEELVGMDGKPVRVETVPAWYLPIRTDPTGLAIAADRILEGATINRACISTEITATILKNSGLQSAYQHDGYWFRFDTPLAPKGYLTHWVHLSDPTGPTDDHHRSRDDMAW